MAWTGIFRPAWIGRNGLPGRRGGWRGAVPNSRCEGSDAISSPVSMKQHWMSTPGGLETCCPGFGFVGLGPAFSPFFWVRLNRQWPFSSRLNARCGSSKVLDLACSTSS
ncbi:hypothetical protein VUR80DRAFT_9743 [Thermomyces stellatus]